ncbi:MAG TPA: peptidylprolyl isomerase, partial [Flavitalea sp.]|nr:peptidylprolyl isomerase [Flavitalea sp.]
MDRKIFTFLFFLFVVSTHSRAQVLFTYGGRTVTKAEFLKAYRKNNTAEKADLQAYRDYLELYIRYKLKVQAAKDRRLDTLANQKLELINFRNQVVESYMNEEASIQALIDEAIERGRKDIHVSHIFVSAPASMRAGLLPPAKEKIDKAYDRLQKGESFESVASDVSEDPSVMKNKGDIGWITVFVLPYPLENIVYATPVGKYSTVYRSETGFHIFKITEERKAKGKVRIAQVLLAFPPDASEALKQEIKKRADSVRKVLAEGGDMKTIAATLSGDNLTYQNAGEMPEFGTGRYEPAFEEAAFQLKKGEVSQPVATSFGYHILKLIDTKPVFDDVKNKQAREETKQQILNNDRMIVGKKTLLASILKLTQFRKYPVSQKSFRSFTDSLLKGKNIVLPDLKATTPLFGFRNQVIRLQDWKTYLQSMEGLTAEDKQQASGKLYEEYIETVAFEYYRNHLETYNPEFAYQLNEFREGNLLFEIMQKNVWDKAASDTSGLQKYYAVHKDKYWWEASADALIFTAANEAAVEKLKTRLNTDYRKWKSYIDSSDGMIQGDSARFELSQIPVVDRTRFS